MIHQTSCWNCSAVYPADCRQCPECHSANANVDLLTAIDQAGGYCHGLFPPSDCVSAETVNVRQETDR